MKKEYLFRQIITKFPSHIVDEYGNGVITSSLYINFKTGKVDGMNNKRREELSRTPYKYVLKWEKCLSEKKDKLYTCYVKEVLEPLDRDLWEICCDKLDLPKDHTLRECHFIVHDYFFIYSGIFVEIDGQDHWLKPDRKLKDEIRDLYVQKKYGKKPMRFRNFGYKFTEFDKEGYGKTDTMIEDPKYIAKEMKRFEKESKARFSDIGYSYIIDQKDYIIKVFRTRFKAVLSIIDVIEEKEEDKIYSDLKSVTIDLSDYLYKFPTLASDRSRNTVSDMFKRLFDKQLIFNI